MSPAPLAPESTGETRLLSDLVNGIVCEIQPGHLLLFGKFGYSAVLVHKTSNCWESE